METGTRIVLTRRECSSPRDNRNIKNRLGKRLVSELIRPNPTKSGVKKLKILWMIGRSKLRNPPRSTPEPCIASKRREDGSTFPGDPCDSRSAEHQLGANRVSLKETFQSSPTHFPKAVFCGDSSVPTYSSPCGEGDPGQPKPETILDFPRIPPFPLDAPNRNGANKSNRKFLISWPTKT